MGFSNEFLWGTASAAHQVEGAYNEDGKGLGIWDALAEGHVKHGENGNIACDHYHRYKEDVALMKQIGVKSYRFSVSWPRVMPEAGVINEKGLQFYKNLVEELVNAGIEPMCTLFHWNLPMWAHEWGGWGNEKTIEYFEEYTKVVVEALSDKVSYWITLNEPQCFIGCGYYTGVHAPFLTRPIDEIKKITRVVMLAHGKSAQAIRKYAKRSPQIGYAPTCDVWVPTDTSEDAIAKARALSLRDEANPFTMIWWSDPIVLGQIPNALKDVISEEDIATIHQPLDFYAYNVYSSSNYGDTTTEKKPEVTPGLARTTMDWVIQPKVMYWATKFLYERYQLPILISENGMASIDFVMLDGKVHDPQRTDYLVRYLMELKKAIDEGIPVIGYQYWSIMDNFEWAEGYDKRFGLIHVDYNTQKRTLKDTAYVYADIIKRNGEHL